MDEGRRSKVWSIFHEALETPEAERSALVPSPTSSPRMTFV